jgi:hypothetical protein
MLIITVGLALLVHVYMLVLTLVETPDTALIQPQLATVAMLIFLSILNYNSIHTNNLQDVTTT